MEQFGWDTNDEFPIERTEHPSSPIKRTLYLHSLDEHSCISHDGYIQLGIFDHSVERHMELNPTLNWVETYWYPDVFSRRYKRATFQKTARANEGSPKTDNQGQGIDYDKIKPKGCTKLEGK